MHLYFQDKNFAKIFEINSRKGLKNKTVSDLQPGDKVRIKIAGMFSKGSEPQYSDTVYTVETVRGSTIYLIGGEVKTLKAGDSFYVAPHVLHGAVCIETGILIDVFSPIREDFMKN